MAGFWSSSRATGPGRPHRFVNAAPGAPALWQPRIVPPPLHTPHPPPVAPELSVGFLVHPNATHRMVAMCPGAGPIRGCPRPNEPGAPRNRLCRAVGAAPRRGKTRSGAGGDSNTWAGERACRHRPGARSQKETGLRPTRKAEAKRCTAQPPSPAPSTVPRETPTRQGTTLPTRRQGVCPSSPSIPRPA